MGLSQHESVPMPPPLPQIKFLFEGLSLLQVIIIGFFLLPTVFLLAFREIFKPVDKRWARRGKAWKLPPGPRGWPIVGNMYQLQSGTKGAQELAQYGEMTTVHLGSKLWVILNSSRVATEFYNRKSSITNERPPMPVANDLMSRHNRSLFLVASEWSEPRRVMQQLLSGTNLTKYAEYQDMESVQLLTEYIFKPNKWYDHHGRYSNSVIHRITLGERVAGLSKKMAALHKVQSEWLAATPPNNFVDCFPALANLPKPFQWWRKSAEDLGRRTYDAYYAYWEPIKRAIANGTAKPSFARDVLLSTQTKFKGNDEAAMFLAAQLVEAGGDTTRITLNIFVLASICYPEPFLKARAEIDGVVGGDAARLPMFADEKQLPYTCAFIKELLRWRPIFIWTPEHTLSQDLEFEGYHFPKGTGFILNHQALSFSPEIHKDPEVFRPDRWLDGHESDILYGLWAFGGGRRVCVGYRLAQKSLFINIARLIYCYNYEAAEPIPKTTVLNHFLPGEPFAATAKARSNKHEKLILEAARAHDVLKYADGSCPFVEDE